MNRKNTILHMVLESNVVLFDGKTIKDRYNFPETTVPYEVLETCLITFFDRKEKNFSFRK